MIMRHLIWKDWRTVRPLFLLILIGIFAINLMLCYTRPGNDYNGTSNLLVAFWYLLPNLFALGAPAMLVGTEEDSGTLGWMRTLPVSWQQIVDSKLVVATFGLIATWTHFDSHLFRIDLVDRFTKRVVRHRCFRFQRHAGITYVLQRFVAEYWVCLLFICFVHRLPG